MTYTYNLEGSNGGYPLNEDKEFDRWFDAVRSTHTCCICQEEGHEDNFYRTNMGWMHTTCYEAIINDPDTETNEIPELL